MNLRRSIERGRDAPGRVHSERRVRRVEANDRSAVKLVNARGAALAEKRRDSFDLEGRALTRRTKLRFAVANRSAPKANSG